MNQTAFDDHIKKQFSEYQPEVPPYIWDKIIAGKERKKPAGFWLTFFNKRNGVIFGLMLLLGAGFIYYITPGKKGQTVPENKIVTSVAGMNNPAGNPPQPLQTNTLPGNLKVDLIPVNDSKSSALTGKMQQQIITSPAEEDIAGTETSFNNETGAYLNSRDFILPRFLLDINRSETKKQFSFNLSLPKMIGLPVPCPSLESNAAANKKYIEVYAGPDYAFRNLSDTGNSTYLSKRKESTRFSYAYSAGIRYTRVFNNSMSIRTGINYSQINEKFTYKEGNIVQVVYIIDNNGDTTGSYTATGTKYKSKNNRYHTADIPLIIGYEVGNGRLHANFNAGAIINVYSWQKGEVLDTANKPVNISTGSVASPYQFRNNIGVGFIGAVSVYYKLNDRLHILAEPYYRYNFSSASKPDLTLKQKYNTAGIRLGIRLDLQ
ncbi:MAG TPA: hypothetical protein VK498_08430 [Ferruginibacter sp.]|nr:hypothetical protein [Ferruginibacter sp.]